MTHGTRDCECVFHATSVTKSTYLADSFLPFVWMYFSSERGPQMLSGTFSQQADTWSVYTDAVDVHTQPWFRFVLFLVNVACVHWGYLWQTAWRTESNVARNNIIEFRLGKAYWFWGILPCKQSADKSSRWWFCLSSATNKWNFRIHCKFK